MRSSVPDRVGRSFTVAGESESRRTNATECPLERFNAVSIVLRYNRENVAIDTHSQIPPLMLAVTIILTAATAWSRWRSKKEFRHVWKAMQAKKYVVLSMTGNATCRTIIIVNDQHCPAIGCILGLPIPLRDSCISPQATVADKTPATGQRSVSTQDVQPFADRGVCLLLTWQEGDVVRHNACSLLDSGHEGSMASPCDLRDCQTTEVEEFTLCRTRQSLRSPGNASEGEQKVEAAQQTSHEASARQQRDVYVQSMTQHTIASATLPASPAITHPPSTLPSTHPGNHIKSTMAPYTSARTRSALKSPPLKASSGRSTMTAAEAYESCPIACPINKQSVVELDTARIANNPKLRNDINFDSELHFRPNTDGPVGTHKRQSQENYWLAVEYELQLVEVTLRRGAAQSIAPEGNAILDELRKIEKRLPQVFAAVGEILTSLVPEGDQDGIRKSLDVDLIMQQINHGVCDLIGLANWLAKIITTHCAPMRDTQVALMAQTVADAVTSSQTHKLADGLRQLVNIMEAMKLDVANHQIRHMRRHLVAETVRFLRKWNDHRVRSNKIDPEKSKKWLEDELVRHSSALFPSTMLDALCSAVLETMSSPVTSSKPLNFHQTFHLDRERLRGISVEIYTYLCREVCHAIMTSLVSCDRETVLKAWNMLQPFLMTISGSHGCFMECVDNIAAQMGHIAAVCSSQEISGTCVAAAAETRLRRELKQDSAEFEMHKSVLLTRLIPKLQTSVHRHIGMSTLQLQDALMHTVPGGPAKRSNGFGAVLEPPRSAPVFDQDASLIRKMTHILVIHWQVWCDVYQAPRVEPVPRQIEPAEEPVHRATTELDEPCSRGMQRQPLTHEAAQ